MARRPVVRGASAQPASRAPASAGKARNIKAAKTKPAKTKPAKTKPAKTKRPAAPPAYRLSDIADAQMTAPQQALRDAISSGPRGIRDKLTGPFQIWLNAPDLGLLAQALGAHVRYNTSLPPRLSETVILATAHWWKAQYEWHVHAPIAERAGVAARTIRDIRAGRIPKAAPKDERTICTFVRELYKTRRVSDRTYRAAHALFGDAGMVELAGICGYYAMVAMALNVFRAPLPPGTPPPFPEPR